MLVEATPEQIRYAEAYLEKGSLAHRGDFDGNPDQQLTGMIGHIIICDILRVPRPVNKNEFDGGFDLVYRNIKWDVKTSRQTVRFFDRPNSKFYHLILDYQINYDCDGYIFISRCGNLFDIRGWISKSKFKELAKPYHRGQQFKRYHGSIIEMKCSGYSVSDRYLNDIEDLMDTPVSSPQIPDTKSASQLGDFV
jgi:hypothetical protein